MLRYLLTALPVILACLMLQAALVSTCVQYYTRFRTARRSRTTQLANFRLLSMIMLLTMIGNLGQIALWACLFLLLGEFEGFSAAFYHSSVNFVTLGYGDIVMSEKWRLLGPLEGANGVLMFGVSTSVMTATVIDVIRSGRVAKAQPRSATGGG